MKRLRHARPGARSCLRQRGQALLYGLFVLLGGLVGLFFLFNTGQLVREKTKLVDTADAVAYSAGVIQARALNHAAYSNRALMAHEALIAQLVSLQSWATYLRTWADRLPAIHPECRGMAEGARSGNVPVAFASAVSALRKFGPDYAQACGALSLTTGLINGIQPKYGVEVKSDSGRHLMGHASLSGGGGSAGYGGIGLPQWVEVSWREPIRSKKFIPSTGNTIDVLDFGKDLGRFRIEVASRIPEDVLHYASAERGRAIKLMFRLLDDDVVMGWCVQEPSKLGGGWIYSNFGGDFVPANWFNGKVVEQGWYLNRKSGQRVPTTTGD